MKCAELEVERVGIELNTHIPHDEESDGQHTIPPTPHTRHTPAHNTPMNNHTRLDVFVATCSPGIRPSPEAAEAETEAAEEEAETEAAEEAEAGSISDERALDGR